MLKALLLSLPSPKEPLHLQSAGHTGQRVYIIAAWEELQAADLQTQTSYEGSAEHPHPLNPSVKSHLTQHFNSAAWAGTPFTNQLKHVSAELQISSGVVSKHSSSASFHHTENPPPFQITPSAQTAVAGYPARAPCWEGAVQTIQWAPGLPLCQNSR